MASSGRVHDRSILDAIEAIEPISFGESVWRITRSGSDALRGSAASGRWSPGGSIEVLYTSLQRDGAMAEIGFRLALEPVWPSRIVHDIHEISLQTERTLSITDLTHLSELGVDLPKYESFDYSVTQALAAAAHFLEFDGMIVPSARHGSLNLVLFMDRGAINSLEVKNSTRVDWSSWRSAP